MALKPKTVKHEGSYDRDQLETNLNYVEAVRRKLTEIKIIGTFTVSTHDNVTAVPRNSLVLIVETAVGTPPGPQGSTLIVRGDALLKGNPAKVAAYRLAAAQASPPAPAGGGAAPKPAAPVPPGSGKG